MEEMIQNGGRGADRGRRISFLTVVTDIFVIAVLVGQFLIYNDYYYNILETKYHYYCICVGGLVGLFVIYGIGRLIVSLVKKKPLFRGKKKKIWERFNSTDWMVLAFIVLVLISTAVAPYKWEAFWGNEGRYTGAFLMSLFVAVYFCVTRCYEIKRWHIELFLISGLIMCFLGIADFMYMDPLHFKDEIKATQRDTFTSTIGNINTYTSCVAMVMAMAGVLFASSKKIWQNIWYGFCVMVTFVALITGVSDNAYLSLAAFFGFMPLYLFRSKEGIRKYLVLLAMFLTAAQGIQYVEVQYAEYVNEIRSLFQVIARFPGLKLAVAGLWLLCALLYLIAFLGRRRRPASGRGVSAKRGDSVGRWIIVAWWGVIVLVVLAVVCVLWDVNVAGNIDRYGASLGKYLYFDDSWGTGRGYAWRVAIENYKKFPLMQKIFGYGPDTFGLITWFNNRKEMEELLGGRFDSAHNELLQYFVTIGPLGTLSYVGIILTSVWNVVKKKIKNPVAVGAMFGVICYNVQALVNINQSIATPVMWMLLCISMAKEKKPVVRKRMAGSENGGGNLYGEAAEKQPEGQAEDGPEQQPDGGDEVRTEGESGRQPDGGTEVERAEIRSEE